MRILVLFTLLILSPQATFKGKVTGVIDGDTIEVLKEGKAVRIRLNGIDCPEKTQAFGTKAKKFTSDLIYGQQVTIRAKELDRYGRTIADVYLQDGTWLNKALIDSGYAWHYKAYSEDKVLANAEIVASRLKIGLWVENQPIPPWEFRRGKKK